MHVILPYLSMNYTKKWSTMNFLLLKRSQLLTYTNQPLPFMQITSTIKNHGPHVTIIPRLVYYQIHQINLLKPQGNVLFEVNVNGAIKMDILSITVLLSRNLFQQSVSLPQTATWRLKMHMLISWARTQTHRPHQQIGYLIAVLVFMQPMTRIISPFMHLMMEPKN